MAEEVIYKRKNCQIKFYPKAHRYMLRESEDDLWDWARGVTTYTGMIDKPALIPWAVGVALKYLTDRPEKEFLRLLKELKNEQARKEFFKIAKKAPDAERDHAAKIGTQVHKAIELFCRARAAEIDFEKMEPEALNCYTQFQEWAHIECYTPNRIEEPVASVGGWYVGTPDGTGTVGVAKRLSVMIDYKTGSGIWAEMLAQIGGYWRADYETFGETHDKYFILNFNKKNWKMVVEEFDRKQMKENVRYFNSLLPAYNFHKKAEKELKCRWKERAE